jgi:hypothetical protein
LEHATLNFSDSEVTEIFGLTRQERTFPAAGMEGTRIQEVFPPGTNVRILQANMETNPAIEGCKNL